MNTKVMIIDNDTSFLVDVKEYLDSVGKFTTDVSTFENISKMSYKEYDIVIANEKISSFVDNRNTVPMFPEFSVGRGFAKYSGKEGILSCIEENHQRSLKRKGVPAVINIFMPTNRMENIRVIKRIQKEISENNRSVLLVDLSYSLEKSSNSTISSSELIFYLATKVEEKDVFIKNVLRSDKNYLFLNGIGSLLEIFEFEKDSIEDVFKQFRDIQTYEYIFIIPEPGLRNEIFKYLKNSDLSVILTDGGSNLLDEILMISQSEDINIMPLFTSAKDDLKSLNDKRVYTPLVYDRNSRFLRRIDEIFSSIDN